MLQQSLLLQKFYESSGSEVRIYCGHI